MPHELYRRLESSGNSHTNTEPRALPQQIQLVEQPFQPPIPRKAEASRLVRDALDCLRLPILARSQAPVVVGELMRSARLGLRPRAVGYACLTPNPIKWLRLYKNQQVIGNRKPEELVHQSMRIMSIVAKTVYANDGFGVDFGLSAELAHKSFLTCDNRYVAAHHPIARLITGDYALYVASLDEIESHCEKKLPQGVEYSPWVGHVQQMAHSTCGHNLARWTPKSTSFTRGLTADEMIRISVKQGANDHPFQRDRKKSEPIPVDGATTASDPLTHNRQDSNV